jgi:hypothetical protein
MKRTTLFLTVTFAAVSLSHAWGGVSVNSSTEKRLETLTGVAGRAADEADYLASVVLDSKLDASLQTDTLNNLRENINQMGRDMAALESERDSLAAWQQETIDRSMPLLRASASVAEATIRSFNENRMHIWVPEYRENVDRLNNELEHLSKVLHSELQLARLRMEEERLEANAVQAGSR